MPKTFVLRIQQFLLGSENNSASIANRILTALQKVEKTLQSHERKFG